MVLQKAYQVQGVVIAQPMTPPSSPSSIHPHDTSIQQILMMFVDTNLQTRGNQYGSTTNTSATDKGREYKQV